MMSSEAPFWKESEIDSILAHETWILVNLPLEPTGCKWIFKKKLNPNGFIEKYKVGLVTKGYSKKQGVHNFDTYSAVIRIFNVRVLLALAASYDLEIYQIDVKTAFLNEMLEEIYINQLEGFVASGQDNKVCKLIRSLYGLKQSLKQWHERFENVIGSNRFKTCDSDKWVYWKKSNDLYVNDKLKHVLYMD